MNVEKGIIKYKMEKIQLSKVG